MPVKTYFAVVYCALFALIAIGVSAQPAPTIDVAERFRVFRDPDAPGSEDAIAVFTWNTTNADEVWILGDHGIEKRGPKGEIDAHRTGGDYLFLAFGPGGNASRYAVATLTSKPGPGRHGIIYNLHEEFNKKSLLENAFKQVVETQKPQAQLANIVLNVLQKRGYTVDLTQAAVAGAEILLYTKDYEFDVTLHQTPQQEAAEGKIDRQIAFVVWLTPAANQWWAYVLPMVKQNHPRDNSKWKPDPDMLQLGRSAAVAVFNAIQVAAR